MWLTDTDCLHVSLTLTVCVTDTVSSERHCHGTGKGQGGVNGIAKVPKRSCPQWDSNPSRTVRSTVQANPLGHRSILRMRLNFFTNATQHSHSCLWPVIWAGVALWWLVTLVIHSYAYLLSNATEVFWRRSASCITSKRIFDLIHQVFLKYAQNIHLSL